MRSTFYKLSLLVLSVLASSAMYGQCTVPPCVNIDKQLQGSRWPAFGTDSGAANAYVVTTIASLGPGLRTGSKIQFFAVHANTTVSTLNTDSTGVKTIKKWSGGSLVDLVSGDISANQFVEVVYDGTYYEVSSVLWDGSLFATKLGVQQQSYVCANDTGSANAYAISLSPTPSVGTYSQACFKAANSNTTASTLAVNGGSAIAIKKWSSGSLAALSIGDITANQIINVEYDGTQWVVLSGGGTSSGGGNIIRTCLVTTGDPDSSSPVLVNGNDSPRQCGNNLAADEVIVDVACYADAGNPIMRPILTGGSSTSILTGDITCSGGSWVTGTVNGTPTLHSFSSDGSTCSSTPCTLDSNLQTADATAKYVVMKYDVQTTGGTTTPINMGTANNHDTLYDNSGSVGGIPPGAYGQSETSVGTSSTPVFSGCHLSNGVNSKTANYTLDVTDNGKHVTFNNVTLTATLPSSPPNPSWCTTIQNLNSSPLTISRNSLTINGGTSDMTLAQYQSATFWTDNSNYFATLPLTGASTTAVGETGGSINGGAFPASAGVVGSNSSSQPISQTAHGIAGPLSCADATGSTTAYTCTTTPTFTPAAKDCIYFTPQTTNTAASTLNVNSSSAAAVQKWLGTGVASGDLPGGKTQTACYDGTNWQVSTIGNAPSGGGACSAGTGNPGTCLIEEHTATTASNVSFTTCFTSSYDVYHITMQDVVMGTASTTLKFQYSTNGGSTWVTSAYSYAGWRVDAGGGTAALNGNSVGFFSVGGVDGFLTTNSPGTSGGFDLYNPLSSTMNKIMANGSTFEDIQGFTASGTSFSGKLANTSAMNAFQIFPSSGTFSGTFRCYGYNK